MESDSDYRLSKRGYYADFLLGPLAIAITILWLFATTRTIAPKVFASSLMAGALAWSFIEYAIHRWIFHGLGRFKKQHRVHHIHSAEYIGASSLTTSAIFCVLFLALTGVFGSVIGTGLFVGILAGYMAYLTLHDLFHHAIPSGGGWVWALYLNHEWHHKRFKTNYGVTSPFWDIVFGTYANPEWFRRRRK